MLMVGCPSLAAILVYDITVKESFDKVSYWLSQLHKFAPKDIVIQIVGNKIDKENERKISKDTLVKFCETNKVLYEETSAKDDIGVGQMFRNVAVGKRVLRSEIGKKLGGKPGDEQSMNKKKLMDLNSPKTLSTNTIQKKEKKPCC
jgi:GTPase SAR1 family protein